VNIRSDGPLLCRLPVPPGGEDSHGGEIEVDEPPGVAGLASGFVHVVADGDEPSVDRQGRLGVVEVAPAEAEQLVAAHAGDGQDPQWSE
jgi:hypothetical protein